MKNLKKKILANGQNLKSESENNFGSLNLAGQRQKITRKASLSEEQQRTANVLGLESGRAANVVEIVEGNNGARALTSVEKTNKFRQQLEEKKRELKANPKKAIQILAANNTASKVTRINTVGKTEIKPNLVKLSEMVDNASHKFKMTKMQKDEYLGKIEKAVESVEGKKQAIKNIFGTDDKYQMFLKMAKEMGIGDKSAFEKTFKNMYKQEIVGQQLKEYETTGDRTKLVEDAAKIEKIRADEDGEGDNNAANANSLGSDAEKTPFEEFYNAFDIEMKQFAIEKNFLIGSTAVSFNTRDIATLIKPFFKQYIDMATLYLISNDKTKQGVKFKTTFITAVGLDIDAKSFKKIKFVKMKMKFRRLIEAKHLTFILDPILSNIIEILKKMKYKVEEKLKNNTINNFTKIEKMKQIKSEIVDNINTLLDNKKIKIFDEQKVVFIGGKKKSIKRKNKKGKLRRRTRKKYGSQVVYSNKNQINIMNLSGGVKTLGKYGPNRPNGPGKHDEPGKTFGPPTKAEAEAVEAEEIKKKAVDAGVKDVDPEVAKEVIAAQTAVTEAMDGKLPPEAKTDIGGQFNKAMTAIKPGEDAKEKIAEVNEVKNQVTKLMGDQKDINMKSSDAVASLKKSVEECLADPTKTLADQFDSKMIAAGKVRDVKAAEEKLKKVLEAAKSVQNTKNQSSQKLGDAKTEMSKFANVISKEIEDIKSGTMRNVEKVEQPKLGSVVTGIFKFFGVDPNKIAESLKGVNVKSIESAGKRKISDINTEMRRQRNLQMVKINEAAAAATVAAKKQMESVTKDVVGDLKGAEPKKLREQYQKSRENLQLQMKQIMDLKDIDPDVKKVVTKQLQNQIDIMSEKVKRVDKQTKTGDSQTAAQKNLSIKVGMMTIMKDRSIEKQKKEIMEEVKKVYGTNSLPNNVSAMINKLKVDTPLNMVVLNKAMIKHKPQNTANKHKKKLNTKRTIKKKRFLPTLSRERKKQQEAIAEATKAELKVSKLPLEVDAMIQKLEPGKTLDIEKVKETIKKVKNDYHTNMEEGLKKYLKMNTLEPNIVKKVQALEPGESLKLNGLKNSQSVKDQKTKEPKK